MKKNNMEVKPTLPTLTECLEAGIRDRSYNTMRNGRVRSFSGQVEINKDGVIWVCVGHGPKGNAYVVTRQGYIEVRRK